MKASAIAGDSRDGHDLALTSRRRRWAENRHHGCCGRGLSRTRVEVVVIQKNILQQKSAQWKTLDLENNTNDKPNPARRLASLLLNGMRGRWHSSRRHRRSQLRRGRCGLGKMWEQMKKTTRKSRIWEAGDGRRE